MKKNFICFVFVVLCLPNVVFAQSTYQKPKLENPESWTLIFIPDIQNYSKRTVNQPILDLMLAWIESHIDSLNIKLVMCPGDLVECNDRPLNTNDGDVPSAEQWAFAAHVFDRFNGKIPCIYSSGNHDYTYSRNGKKIYSEFRNYFTTERNPLTQKSLCQIARSPDNHLTLENAAYQMAMPDGKKYLFLSLEYAPRDTIVNWANQVVKMPQYKNDRIVLLTHSYINDNNKYTTSHSGFDMETCLPNNFFRTSHFDLVDANTGSDLWNKLVKPNNIELVLCGHVFGVGYRCDKNDSGNKVHQILFDTQADGGGHRNGNGGDGWIRILEFFPDGKTVKVKTFSPLFACSPSTCNLAWKKDPKNEFTMTFDK